jgi:hypothetical protein
MDAPPQQAEPAPVVVPASYPSSDADSFFDRTWFETGAIDVSQVRQLTEAEPMRVEHVTVTPQSATPHTGDPIAASLAAEHGLQMPEPMQEPIPADRPVDERPVFERPVYAPVQLDDADSFFETAPVVGTAPAVTAEALAASYESVDTSSPMTDRTAEFESYFADSSAISTPEYTAETPGEAWYVEPAFVKGEGIVPAGGTPSRWGKILVPIALGAVAVMALVAGWTHLQNGNTDSTIVVAPTNQSAASTVPTVAPVVPTPVSSAGAIVPSVAPVVPSPGASSATPVVASGDRSVPVVVLNGAGVSGLAAKVAAELKAKGWNVISVGNHAAVAQTTVYSPGPRTASVTMRHDVPQASLTHKPLPGMSKTHITLVLGSDYSA